MIAFSMSVPKLSARSSRRRKRHVKQDSEIVLICNPRAGGRWKELAGILDSEEAGHVRRIVTDSVDDIALALSNLGREAKLLCIYGGDGTIQRVLDRLSHEHGDVQLALLGGGTMNVTSRWCGFSTNPGRNFRYVVRAFVSGELLSRELPVMKVQTGDVAHHGFTFGMGPIVRLLDAYERGRKGKLAAVGMAVQAVAAAWTRWPQSFQSLLAEMEADVELDGERLAYHEFSAVFANVTGQINPGIEPFVGQRARESFHCVAYAVGAREMTLLLPMLARGRLPLDVDLSGLLSRSSRMPKLQSDARYVNRTAKTLKVTTAEDLYTVDGELLPVEGQEISVELGPMLRLATGPLVGWKMAAEAVKPGG